jgi:hypothetical protein
MRKFHHSVRVVLLGSLVMAGAALPAAAEPTPDETYQSPDAWLCRPGRADPCGAEQTVTIVSADGTRRLDTVKPSADAPIDCFYVYPTISIDPNGNSSLTAGPGERRAVEHQFAPFASVCRPFAPMYRQVTLAGLRSVMQGKPMPIDPQLGLEDVRAAWRHYLANDNRGRGAVLVGHSQGSRMLVELLRRDIDGTSAQKLLVSAVIPGFNFNVPAGADVGGSLKSIPLCRSATQTGCVIAYSTFRASAPPPQNARFGRSSAADVEVACVDPVRLSGIALRSFMPAAGNLLGQQATLADWKLMVTSAGTTFVEVSGMMKAGCVKDGLNSYLALSFDSAQRGTRPQDIPGDIVSGGRLFDDWGLHLIDMNIVMGNLLETVRRQGAAFVAGKQ